MFTNKNLTLKFEQTKAKICLRSIRINQLQASTSRWQHGSRDMFGTFFLVKNHKLGNNSRITEASEKIRTVLKLLEF